MEKRGGSPDSKCQTNNWKTLLPPSDIRFGHWEGRDMVKKEKGKKKEERKISPGNERGWASMREEKVRETEKALKGAKTTLNEDHHGNEQFHGHLKDVDQKPIRGLELINRGRRDGATLSVR